MMEKNKDKIKRLEEEVDKLREKNRKLEKDCSIACNASLAFNEASEAFQIQMVKMFGEECVAEDGSKYRKLIVPKYDVKALFEGYEKSAGTNGEEFVIVMREKNNG